MNRYVTVKCPGCRSVSHIKAEAVRSEHFYCPVCGDSEIEYRPVPPSIFREDAGLYFEMPELAAVRVTSS